MKRRVDRTRRRSRETIDFVDNDSVESPCLDVFQQPAERRPVDVAAGEPAIVVSGGESNPPFVLLTLDVGLARLALRIERVERLIEPFF
jgi:hypothetical protein